jgi:hypothetical protein
MVVSRGDMGGGGGPPRAEAARTGKATVMSPSTLHESKVSSKAATNEAAFDAQPALCDH